ncbi:hypothetical protein AAY473_021648, partial [Plecturocebus cupreus]
MSWRRGFTMLVRLVLNSQPQVIHCLGLQSAWITGNLAHHPGWSEQSSMILAHRNLLGSGDSPPSASQRQGFTMLARVVLNSTSSDPPASASQSAGIT